MKMAGKAKYWREVLVPVAIVVAASLGAGLMLSDESVYAQAVEQIVNVVWLVAAIYVGWRVKAKGAGLLGAALAGAVFGFVAEILLNVLMIAGAYAGIFGVAVNFALVAWWKVAATVAVDAGFGAARSAALAALGALALIFTLKMREAG